MHCSICCALCSKFGQLSTYLLRRKANAIARRFYSDKWPSNFITSAGGMIGNCDDKISDEKQSKDNEVQKPCNISGSSRDQRILLVHPRVRKMALKNTTVQQQIDEAQTLCETIPGFTVVSAIVLNTDAQLIRKKLVWGVGRLERIREWMLQHPVNALCINIDILAPAQQRELNSYFGIPVYDRYNIVLNIFKLYARTEEARLQIALAEIPYIRDRLCYIEANKSSTSSDELAESLNVDEVIPSLGRTTEGTRRVELLRMREHSLRKQIRNAIASRANEVRHRLEASASANASKMAVIGVIGYTNAGKTSLIKSLTDEQSLCGEDRPFATLDTTLHQAVLPSRHKILLADTIGFISNLPIKLFASFTATLQYIESADLLIHVMDLSHRDILSQRDQVIETLKGLNIRRELIDGIITVGNKLDKCGPERLKWLRKKALLPPEEEDTEKISAGDSSAVPSLLSPFSLFPLPISCRTLDGMASLIRRMDCSTRSIIGSRIRRFRLAPGSTAIPYLYSEGLVPAEGPTTSECGQFLIFDISMTDAQLARFKSVMGARIKLKKLDDDAPA
ncbi:hypothetical protein niasHS_000627 [Heterodera schachtii]|uniref:Hflx-type G domain-containing protein n=1 Tax=Heterodera schachtii TaxID=97005 RepID=A0ABD2K4U2_HETSC